MKTIISIIFISILINFISSKVENATKEIKKGVLFEIGLGPDSTKVQMLLNTFTTENSLYTNSNRKHAKEIHQKRNGSQINETFSFNKEIVPEFFFNLKPDPTEFENKEIQGEFGLGIDLNGKNPLIDFLYKNKIIFQKELIIGGEIILDTYLVTDGYYYCNLTDRADLDSKYHQSWMVELSHILTGSSPKEFNWDNTEQINARAILDSSSKYIYLLENYINLILDIWKLNLTKCPIIEEEINNKTVKFFRCSNITKDYFSKIKPIYFIFDGYAFLFKAEELFEKTGNNIYESLIRFRPETNDLWTFGVPFFKKYKVRLNYVKHMIGFNGPDIINFHKEYKRWKEENEQILNKASNDKKIVAIGAIMGSMILITILFCLCKSCRTDTSRRSSKFVEEQNLP